MKRREKGFRCYSVPLKDYLTKVKGIEYLCVALDCKSQNTMWVFLRDKELDNALTEWTKANPRKQA